MSREFRRLEALVGDRLAGHLGVAECAVDVDIHGFEVDLFAELDGGRPLEPGEHVAVLLALVPHLHPDFYPRVIGRYLPDGGDLAEFGGVRAEHHRGVLPTGETAQFVLAGTDLDQRVGVQRMFATDHWFSRHHVMWLDPVRDGEPAMSGRLVLDPEVVERLTTGTVTLPRFSSQFPAEHVETAMDWADVVLRPETLRSIRDIEHWMRFNDTVLDGWGMHKRVRPGYRVMFHGPPGTGKTLVATLLGKTSGRPVFRIDLSRVVSKYIGETEKNLSSLFDRAEHKNWILFFDEADALFGKRTDIRDAHDKYANQEVSYLLQRIETHAGLVILATNQRGNIDEAFLRRFQLAVSFSNPRPEERRELWQRSFPPQVELTDDVDWSEIATRFELSGAAIVNVCHYCALEALGNGSLRIDRATIEEAIVREFVKDGKIV
ncbi:MAG: ATP-binding protein [Ilumatobacteraceae bacterium]